MTLSRGDATAAFNQGPHGGVNRCMVPIRIGSGHIEAPLGDDHFVYAKA